MNTLLQFMDASADSDDDGFVARASDFLGMEIASQYFVKLYFRGSKNRTSVDTVQIPVPDLQLGHDGTGSNDSFRNISEAVAGLLNGGDKYYVVADANAGTFMYPFGAGTVTVTLADA